MTFGLLGIALKSETRCLMSDSYLASEYSKPPPLASLVPSTAAHNSHEVTPSQQPALAGSNFMAGALIVTMLARERSTP